MLICKQVGENKPKSEEYITYNEPLCKRAGSSDDIPHLLNLRSRFFNNR